MKNTLYYLSTIALAMAIGWSLIAVANGKVGTLFGTEIFIASATDMEITLIALIIAVAALAVNFFARPSVGAYEKQNAELRSQLSNCIGGFKSKPYIDTSTPRPEATPSERIQAEIEAAENGR